MRRDRGSALLEAAITAPLFIFVLFAVFEFGLAFRSYLSVTSATRDSTRMAAVQGSNGQADYYILQRVKATLGTLKQSDIESISIFKATGPTSSTASGALASCRNGSVNGLCNRYVASDLNRPLTDFGCNSSSPDKYWCPTGRKTAVSSPPDYVGVYIRVSHKGPTVFANITKTISDEVVMRIEPDRLA